MRRLAPLLLIVGLTVVVAPAARGDDGGLAAARARANKAAAELAAARTRSDELAGEVADLQRQTAESAANMALLEGQLRQLAVARYVTASQPDQLFAGEDINRQVTADALLRLVNGGDQGTVDRFKAEKADLDVAQAALAARLAEQQQAVEQLRAKRAAVDAELRHLEQLQREKEAAEKQRLAARGASVGTPIASGEWICPVQGAHAFSNDYGQPRSGGRRHQGIDILAPRGTPVVAPVSGTATERNNDLGGITFWLDGGDGNSYYGAHLDSWAGNSGHVAAGTRLGTVGTTGNAAGGPPHLHFEIHPGGGAAINPFPTLSKYC